jgi:7,8-dihydropterin-6-yl-methyl-4-(beta-D-ribofuranosyl)aminobenzene 5'-phosphate synthase
LLPAIRFLGGSCLCCAAHGLSCLITIHREADTRTLLFDTGPEDRTFEQNVSRLGVNLGTVEAMVLSHGHFDHSGAMLRALQLIRDRNGGRDIAYYTHPDMFRTRATKQPNGSVRRWRMFRASLHWNRMVPRSSTRASRRLS